MLNVMQRKYIWSYMVLKYNSEVFGGSITFWQQILVFILLYIIQQLNR